jgi:hypothetical protein
MPSHVRRSPAERLRSDLAKEFEHFAGRQGGTGHCGELQGERVSVEFRTQCGNSRNAVTSQPKRMVSGVETIAEHLDGGRPEGAIPHATLRQRKWAYPEDMFTMQTQTHQAGREHHEVRIGVEGS